MNSTDFYPSKLWAVANDCNRPAPQLDIHKIKGKILQNQARDISRIEWFWIITSNQAWQGISHEEGQQLAIEIWAIALELYGHVNFFELHNDDCWLLKELAHRLLCQNQGQKLANFFIKGWYDFPNNRCPSEAKLVFEVLKIIQSYHGSTIEQQLLRLTYQYKLLPSQLWAKTDAILPRLDCLKQYFYQLPYFFKNIGNNIAISIQFFIDVLENINDFASEDEQAQVVDLCLIQWQVAFFDDKTRLLQWFIKEYHKTPKSSLLSSEAIAKLYQLVGVISYQVFDSIVKSVIRNIKLESHEQRWLNDRKEFWKNYTERFVDIRVFLPSKSSALFTNDITNQVSILENDGSEESEVCIFELENGMLIVEIFRGEGGDLRIFSNQYKNFLFTQSLSIQKIRALGGERHDHKFLWQYFCEKLLREKYKIFPNKNTSLFYGLPPKYANYSFVTGLPTPPPEKIQEREKKLSYWIKKIENLERQARLKYSNL